MDLTLAEQFLLLAHHTDKKRFVVPGNQTLMGMLGAMLLDLIEAGDIKIIDDKIICTLQNQSDSIHPEMFSILENSKKPRKIKAWIQRLSYNGNKLKKTLFLSMSQKRYITLEQKKFLGLIPYNITGVINKSRHRANVSHMKGILLLNKEATRREQLLLSILLGSGILPHLGRDREERKNIRKKAKNYKQTNPVGSEVDKAIQEMQAAIAVSIAATAATSSASHH
jgi:Golgi phosphoprotein 3